MEDKKVEEKTNFGMSLADFRKIRESMEPPLELSNSPKRKEGTDFFTFFEEGADKLWGNDQLSSFFKIDGERIG